MTTSSYIIAWIIYLSAVGGVSVIAWNLSRNWRTGVQYVSRVSLLVLLLTPYYSDPEHNRLAPAILVSLFELVFGEARTGIESATPLILLLVVCAAAASIYAATRPKLK